jgi:hypothetical protein
MIQNLSRRNAMRAMLPAAAGLAAVATAKAEPQPHMQRALAALKTAESNLESATPDKGGHRVAALKLVREAMEQVDKGMRFDDRNPRR